MFERLRKLMGHESTISVDVDELIAIFGPSCGVIEMHPVHPELQRAKVADLCRDVGLRPASEREFSERWQSYDDEHQRRFALLIFGFRAKGAAQRMRQMSVARPDQNPVFNVLHELTVELSLLTVSMLGESDVRLEEFARHFCQGIGVGINGESAEESTRRLQAIDFKRLTQEAETARASAQDRLAYLKKMQDEQEQTRRPRRGKW